MSIADLRKALKSEKLFFGAREAIKNLKRGKLKKIFLAENCPENIRNDIEYLGKLAKVEVIKLKQPNDELALICKKRVPVSVISY